MAYNQFNKMLKPLFNFFRLTCAVGLLFLCFNISAQEKNVADLWMECVYANYPNNGAGVKSLIAEYQQELIDNNVLDNGAPTSYKALVNKLRNPEYKLEYSPSSFIKQIEALDPQVDNKAINTCHDALESLAGFNAVIGLFEDKMEALSLEDQLNFSSYFGVLNSNFTKPDFKTDFLKMMVFIGLNLDEVVPAEPDNEFALLIQIKPKDLIYVNQQEVTLGVLQDEVFEYIDEVPLYGAAFQINYLDSTSQEILRQVESLVKLVIDQARENYAQNYYAAKYVDLDSKTQEDIAMKYPQVIKLKLVE